MDIVDFLVGFDDVFFFNIPRWVDHIIGKSSVVCHKEQAFSLFIEAAYGEQTVFNIRKQIENSWVPFCRTNITSRLVEKVIDLLCFWFHSLSVYSDLILRHDGSSKKRNGTIHGNATCKD